MADGKPLLRIDWFDGSVIDDENPSRSAAFFDENDQPAGSEVDKKPIQTEKKPIGFKRLLDISLMEPDKMTLEVSYRPGFWNLLDQPELKGDFIVLIVKMLDSIFKTIRLDRADSKMTKLLETRFLPSDFLKKLTGYLYTLPNVKIVEKRMNSQLWDDIEAFFFQVVSLCEGITYFHGKKSKDLSKRLDKLLKGLRMSAVGVAQEHFERIGEELFEKISKLEGEIDLEEILISATSTKDSPTFKSLNIFPTQQDLCTPKSAGQPEKETTNILQNIKIAPSIVHGAYPSIEHYLDIQFRLLREDYFGPLREGISKYLENPFKTRHENIRVHKDVRILSTVVKNNKVGHLVDLTWKERTIHQLKQKVYNKELMFGSLLLFTSDEFRTILCATVLDSDVNMLKDGYVVVSFQNPVSKEILSNTYIMVECEVFFEPYHQVLKVLQGSRLDKLPMQKYIVDVKPEIHPPAYLTPETVYTIKDPDESEIPFKVLDTDHWPTEHLDLDDSQLEAFKFALTREFAVIQGPPGTGKTFLGIKIASTILENLSLKDTPMLVICYTNNALDQFLEGILHVTDKVIRLGSQSKSSKLEPYNLKNVRAKMNCKHHGFSKSKRELEMIYKEMTELQSEIETCETGILCYRNLKPKLKIDDKQYELKYSREDRVFHWLFEHLEDPNSGQKKEEEIEEDSWENYGEIVAEGDNIEECFSEKKALKQIENIKNTIKQLTDLNIDVEKNPERIRIFKKEADKIRERLDCFKNQMESHKKDNKEYKIESVDDLYNLNTAKRWQMYFNAVGEVRDELLAKMDVLLEKHKAVSLELEDLSTQVDGEVVRSARVVGVTTTAAARRHQLINKINSPIVIVEEAAEVLEAHIIASLTFSLQHLILIGDHKQLRPTAANYQLAKKCNFEVSLFERMIGNSIHARTLTTQRRMRPNFVDLLVPEIYPELRSHESVLKYGNVNGMGKNMFFLTHEVLEDSESPDDSWSHENSFEAEWCVALSRYLLTKGYSGADITVLATYRGQVSRIKKLSHKFEALKDVKITAVDNFQGEESKIVILSLVRSNKDGKIGFLSATNRICVTLSRAKEGFYIFGNMTMLSKASTMWMTINKKLISQDAIGDRLCTENPALHIRTAAELHDVC